MSRMHPGMRQCATRNVGTIAPDRAKEESIIVAIIGANGYLRESGVKA